MFCKYSRSCESPFTDINLNLHVRVVLFTSLLWSRLYFSIFLYFSSLNYTHGSPMARTLHLISVYGCFGWNTSSSPPPPLLCPRLSSVPVRLQRHNAIRLAFRSPGTSSLRWSCRQRHKRKLATSGSSPHDRDESLGGWEEEFKKTDKYSSIATYLKQLIIYGRWCGIFSVGCLWTNSAVLCKLPIWPSLCILLTLVALHSHMLGAVGPHRQRDKVLPV